MNLFRSAPLFLASLAIAASAFGQASVGTDDDAQKLSAAAAARIGKVGKDQAMKDFATDKQFAVKDLTVWVMDTNGVMRYHANPKMIGKDLIDVKDQSGRAYNKEMVALGKGTKPGSISYEWAHPETKKLVPKVAYITPAAGTDVFTGVSVTH